MRRDGLMMLMVDDRRKNTIPTEAANAFSPLKRSVYLLASFGDQLALFSSPCILLALVDSKTLEPATGLWCRCRTSVKKS